MKIKTKKIHATIKNTKYVIEEFPPGPMCPDVKTATLSRVEGDQKTFVHVGSLSTCLEKLAEHT